MYGPVMNKHEALVGYAAETERHTDTSHCSKQTIRRARQEHTQLLIPSRYQDAILWSEGWSEHESDLSPPLPLYAVMLSMYRDSVTFTFTFYVKTGETLHMEQQTEKN